MGMNAEQDADAVRKDSTTPNDLKKAGVDICKICVVVLLVLIGAEDMIGPLI